MIDGRCRIGNNNGIILSVVYWKSYKYVFTINFCYNMKGGLTLFIFIYLLGFDCRTTHINFAIEIKNLENLWNI